MEKVIIELTAGESIDVYRCIRIKIDEIKNECYRTQDMLDEMETTHIAYQGTKDNLETLTNILGYYTGLMDKFRPKMI